MLALAVPVVLLARDEFERGRFYILLLSSLYGACMILSADSFLTLFLGLELMSLPVYVLVLLAYRRPESAEAALKYLVLSGAATATFLMGASLLYGASGSLALPVFAAALVSGDRARAGRRRAGDRRLLPQGGGRPVPRLGAGRVRGRQRPGDRLHGHHHQGRRAAGGRSPLRHGAPVAADRRAHRVPAARVDRLGEPGRDAAVELPPDDRVLLHRARRLPLLRVPRRRSRPVRGGRSSTWSPTG